MGITYIDEYYLKGLKRPVEVYPGGSAANTYIAHIDVDKDNVNTKYLLTIKPRDFDLNYLERPKNNAFVKSIEVDEDIDRVRYYFDPEEKVVEKQIMSLNLKNYYYSLFEDLFNSVGVDGDDTFFMFYSIYGIYKNDEKRLVRFLEKLNKLGFAIATTNIWDERLISLIGKYLTFISFNEFELGEIGKDRLSELIDSETLVLVHKDKKGLGLMVNGEELISIKPNRLFFYSDYPSAGDIVDIAFIYSYYVQGKNTEESLIRARDFVEDYIYHRFYKVNNAAKHKMGLL